MEILTWHGNEARIVCVYAYTMSRKLALRKKTYSALRQDQDVPKRRRLSRIPKSDNHRPGFLRRQRHPQAFDCT